MSNALSLPSGDHGTARIPSILSVFHLCDSGIILTFAARVLIASPCSVTTTASDDEFSMPTNIPGRYRGSHFLLLLAWPTCARPSLQIPRWCLSVAADVTPVHQIRSELHKPAQYPCIRWDFDANTMLQRSFQCSGLTSHESHRAFGDSVGVALSHWLSLWHSLASLLASLCNFPCQRVNRWFVVASGCNSVVPKLINELCCSPCSPWKFSSFSRNQHRPHHVVSFHR